MKRRLAKLNFVLAFSALSVSAQWVQCPPGTSQTCTTSFVGIGTTAPANLLHIANGAVQHESNLDGEAVFGINSQKSRGSATGKLLVADGDSLGFWTFYGYDGSAYRPSAGIRSQIDGAPSSTSMPGRIIFSTTPANATAVVERMRINSAGNVGVGTSAPLRLFSVGDGASGTIQATEIGNFGGDTVGKLVFSYSNANVEFVQTHPSVGVFRWLYGGAEKMRLDRNGRLGIGTTNPTATLDVQGGASFTSFLSIRTPGSGIDLFGTAGAPNYIRFNDTANPGGKSWRLGETGATPFGNFDLYNETDNTIPLSISGSGNVGIGGSAQARLDVRRTVVDSGVEEIARLSRIGGSTAFVTNRGAALTFYDSNNPTLTAAVVGVRTNPAGNFLGDLAFYTHAGLSTNATSITALTERMRLTSSGNVGIGTSQPTATLHVVGDATFTGEVRGGNIRAKYQDIAEWVPSTGNFEPGTVVVLDEKGTNRVTRSATSYDTRVAGVISAQPGLSLGESGDGKSLVATTGRVRVKVDARNAAVKVGDLLVTSDTPGTAMRSEAVNFHGRKFHQPGTIIGKALEPIPGGTGEILVLLSLQ